MPGLIHPPPRQSTRQGQSSSTGRVIWNVRVKSIKVVLNPRWGCGIIVQTLFVFVWACGFCGFTSWLLSVVQSHLSPCFTASKMLWFLFCSNLLERLSINNPSNLQPSFWGLWRCLPINDLNIVMFILYVAWCSFCFVIPCWLLVPVLKSVTVTMSRTTFSYSPLHCPEGSCFHLLWAPCQIR